MRFSLKKKNLKVLQSKDLDTTNIMGLEQTKMINGASSASSSVPTLSEFNNPKDPGFQVPTSVIALTDMVK